LCVSCALPALGAPASDAQGPAWSGHTRSVRIALSIKTLAVEARTSRMRKRLGGTIVDLRCGPAGTRGQLIVTLHWPRGWRQIVLPAGDIPAVVERCTLTRPNGHVVARVPMRPVEAW
jgi:hypothetical protein